MTATKRYILCGIILMVVFGGLLLWRNIPRPAAENAEIYRVIIVENGQEKNVTEKCVEGDIDALVNALKIVGWKKSIAPYERTEGTVEIDGNDGEEPLHIILGDVNVVYSDGAKGGYDIASAESFKSAVMEMIK